MKQLFGYLWGFALLIAALDFVLSPEDAMRDAFETVRTPGPRFGARKYSKSSIRPTDLGSPAESERLQRKGLETLERIRRMNLGQEMQ